MHSAKRFFITLLDSTVGQKVITAATGLGLVGFAVIHMLGNLQIFAGPTALNEYAAWLKSMGGLLWIARGGLLAIFVLHIAMTIRLRLRNNAARTSEYAKTHYQRTTTSSRWMIVSGTVILGFVVFHLLHFTFGVIQPANYNSIDEMGRHDVRAMVVGGFQNLWIIAFYAVAMLFLASHLSHALFSVTQTVGLNRRGRRSWMSDAAAWLLVIGFLAVPFSIAFGIVN